MIKNRALRNSVVVADRLMPLLDVIAVGLAGVVAYRICLQQSWNDFDFRYAVAIAAGATLGGLVFSWLGVYRRAEIYIFGTNLARVANGWMITSAMLLALPFSLGIQDQYPRVWAFGWLTTSGLFLLLMRYALWRHLGRSTGRSHSAERTVVVGAGENGQRLAKHIGQQSLSALRLIGFVDDRSTRVPPVVENYPNLGNVNRLIQMIRDGLVDQVIIALPWSADQRLQDLIYRLALTPVHISLAPDFAGLLFSDRPFIQQAGVPMLRVLDRPISGWMYVAKRIEDIVLAVLALLLLWPLLLGICIAIRLDTPGPTVFSQPRYGFNNSIIRILKFRTMYAEMSDIEGETQTTRNDQRVTRVGRWLRRTSFDELPQIFNVLRGDMSVVGPRAHATGTTIGGKLLEAVTRKYAARHRVLPGITGWAQVNGLRGELNSIERLERRTEYDLYYINNWSVWLDILIILKTIPIVIHDPNAY